MKVGSQREKLFLFVLGHQGLCKWKPCDLERGEEYSIVLQLWVLSSVRVELVKLPVRRLFGNHVPLSWL